MTFDAARFRHVMGHCPTPVTVVTANGVDGPVGLTVGSFTSVSLDPPLVAFLPGKKSDSWPVIEATGTFCVNILAADQAELCWLFAGDAPDKFAEVGWTKAPGGDPILEGALAWIDCRIEQVIEAGDHWIVLGRVLDLGIAREEATAMTFFKGKVGSA
jgi:3-hydroxy-9,10-secoandrosta-1,3,5(10)-triene-9,17-dione monooxygenase reductase component